MSEKSTVKDIIQLLNGESTSLNAKEREQLRDELLAMLLFSEFRKNPNPAAQTHSNFRELKKAERDLIKKLADQTDALYKLSRTGDIDND
jgi:hypothetical protein